MSGTLFKNLVNMDKRFCKVCGEEINPLRVKALPSAVTCVEHSNTAPKRGRILTLGSGDHTYNEIEILDEEAYKHVTAIEFGERSPLDEMPEMQDYSATSLADYSGSLKKQANRFIEEDEEDGFVLPDDYDEREP